MSEDESRSKAASEKNGKPLVFGQETDGEAVLAPVSVTEEATIDDGSQTPERNSDGNRNEERSAGGAKGGKKSSEEKENAVDQSSGEKGRE
jgi:hypothetical protein